MPRTQVSQRQMMYKDYAINEFKTPIYGFPDSLRVQLRYADVFTLASTLGAINYYRFRANSAFDPDSSSTGHQPLYYDTYGAIYDHYAVINSRIELEVTGVGAATAPIVGLNIDDDSSVAGTLSTLLEQNHGTNTLMTALSGSHSFAKLSTDWNAEEILRIDPFKSQTYKTAIGQNPSEESYFVFWVVDNTAAASTSVTVKVNIVYDILFTELSTITGS